MTGDPIEPSAAHRDPSEPLQPKQGRAAKLRATAEPDLKRVTWAGTVARRVQIALERLNFEEAHCAVAWGESTYEDSIASLTDPEETAIAELDLPVRIINALDREGRMMVSHLLAMSRSQLIAIPGVGEKCLEIIEEALVTAGFGERPIAALRKASKFSQLRSEAG
jgi:DNA-directed RNA polymerase alpha subunit